MSWVITNWENDMIDKPEQIVAKFVAEKYPNMEFKMLSGLGRRDIHDIYRSLEESRVIIMQPSMLEPTQIAGIVQQISHPIHGALNGAIRRYDIADFIFLSANPWEDYNIVKDACRGVKDNHNEYSLTKILRNCECHFYGFDGTHYEMRRSGYEDSVYAVRHK